MPEDRKIEPIPQEVSPQPAPLEAKKEQESTFEEKGGESTTPTPVESPGVPIVSPPATPSNVSTRVPVTAKSDELIAIEHILEEDLEDLYWQLSEREREKLKRRGEKTARTLERLVQRVRLHAMKVLRLIQKWIGLIPHVNRFFLEQEAKIKTDKIIALHKDYHHPS